MEVKSGPYQRSWGNVSIDATPECCERLRMHWQQQMNNQELNWSLPRVIETIVTRRLRIRGHCSCHKEA